MCHDAQCITFSVKARCSTRSSVCCILLSRTKARTVAAMICGSRAARAAHFRGSSPRPRTVNWGNRPGIRDRSELWTGAPTATVIVGSALFNVGMLLCCDHTHLHLGGHAAVWRLCLILCCLLMACHSHAAENAGRLFKPFAVPKPSRSGASAAVSIAGLDEDECATANHEHYAHDDRNHD